MQRRNLLAILFVVLFLGLGVSSSILVTVYSQESGIIPSWIRNTAGWWSTSQISDEEFTKGLGYLIQNNIIEVPQTSAIQAQKSDHIPSWLQKNAGWWSQGLLSDDEFVKGIQYLINNRIIVVETNTDSSLCSGTSLCISGKIERIVDGDTIYVEGHKIRLSLTDTPEKNEYGFSEASDFTRQLCPIGSFVTIDQDDMQPYDVYGRVLGKVHCGDKVLNSELLSSGQANILTQYCSTSEFSNETWAQKFGCSKYDKVSISSTENATTSAAPTLTAVTISSWEIKLSWIPPTDTFKQSITGYVIEREVIEDILYEEIVTVNDDTTTYIVSGLEPGKTYSFVISANLSIGNSPRSNSVSATTEIDFKPTESLEQDNCDPSYPDFCIPSPPPDLDCKDIPQKRFTVLQPDPHRFDGDKDGIGCES